MNKYKKLAANTLIFSLGSFSSKILSILLLRLYTEYMTKADYSVATQIQNIINLLGPVVTLSISESILRYGLNKKYNRKNVYSTGVITGLAGMAVGMIVLWLITSFTRFKPYLPLMMVFLFTSEFRWMQQQYTKVRNCIKCGSCMTHCPQGIPITEKLGEVQALVDEINANRPDSWFEL